MARQLPTAHHRQRHSDRVATGEPIRDRGALMPHNRPATAAAIILSLAAAGAPTASAMPAGAESAATRAPARVYSYPEKAMIAPAAPTAGSGSTSVPPILPAVKPPQ